MVKVHFVAMHNVKELAFEIAKHPKDSAYNGSEGNDDDNNSPKP